jgi:HEAT repeat protein
MARASVALQNTLEQLARARSDPSSAASVALLRTVLAGKSSHAAAQAAEIAAAAELESLTADLVAAFERWLAQPARADPGCAAKAAIANALYRIGAPEIALYRKGIRHVQLEPVWGGTADTASGLRGTCALALVRVNAPDYLTAVGDLLADRDAAARHTAAQALAYSENPAAVPLLRLKALLGDEEPRVIGECLLALLALDPSGGMEFAAGFLQRERPEVAEAAALALGGSRVKAALPVLTAWWERAFDPTLRQNALLAIAMLKHDEALQYLLAHVAEAAPMHARHAVQALALYRHDARLRARVEQALAARDDASLRSAFVAAFGADGAA